MPKRISACSAIIPLILNLDHVTIRRRQFNLAFGESGVFGSGERLKIILESLLKRNIVVNREDNRTPSPTLLIRSGYLQFRDELFS